MTDSNSKPALTLHHLRVSQSERIVFLLEELQLPYTLITHVRSPVLSPPDLANLPGNALSAAPVLLDTSPPFYSEQSPLTLPESGAIVEYIIQRHGGGRLALKPDHKDFAAYEYWFHFANGNLQSSISGIFRLALCGVPEDTPMYARMRERFHVMLKHIDDRLTKTGAWLAGDEFTAADIMSVFSLSTMRSFNPFPLTGYDGIVAWLGRISQRDGYKRAMEKGDPDLTDGRCMRAEAPPLFEPLRQMMAPPKTE